LWTELTLVDDDGQPVESGQRGEIVVSGPTVTAGYYGDVDANVDAFCEHGLRTGDVGYTDEQGYLYVLNRLDDRIISGGENIDPGEIVELLRSHPEVDEAAVVGIPDETWGERVAALVVPKRETLSEESVETFCRERLAGYKLPRLIAVTNALPRTASGTIKRPAVRDQLSALAEADGDDSTEVISVASETDSVDAIPAESGPDAESTGDRQDEQSTGDATDEQPADSSETTNE
jgi:O-succinylbenzoic acid--CoA ligase